MNLHEMGVKRSLMLLSQTTFMMTRLQAFEDVLSTPRAILKAILWPGEMKRLVDNRQKELLAAEERKMEKAQTKQVIKPVVLSGR
jgi:hypothetical protein